MSTTSGREESCAAHTTGQAQFHGAYLNICSQIWEKTTKKTVKKSPQTKQNKRYPTKSKPTSTPVPCIRFLGFKMGWGPTLSSVRDPHSSSPHFPINQRSSDHSASDQQNQRAAAKRYFLCLRLFGPAPCPTQSLVPCPEGKTQM